MSSSSSSIIDSSLQSTILHALSRLANPSTPVEQIKLEFIDAALRQRCHLPIVNTQRNQNESIIPRCDVDQSWESEAVDPGYARTDVRDKNRARGSSPERSVFSSEQQKLAHHYVKAVAESAGKTLTAIANDASVSRAVGESSAVQGFAKVLSTLSLASQSSLLGPLLSSQVESLTKIRKDIGVRRDISGSVGTVQTQSSAASSSGVSSTFNSKKRPRTDDTDSNQKDSGGDVEANSSSRQGLFEALERGNRQTGSGLSLSTVSPRDVLSSTSSSSSTPLSTLFITPPPHELRFRCAVDSLSGSSRALLKSLDLWGKTLDRVSEVCGKFNGLEDAFMAQANDLSTRISSLHIEVTACENRLQIKNNALMNLLTNNSDQLLVTNATEERGSAAAALKASKDQEAEAIAAREWHKELVNLCNAGRNFTLVSSMRAQTSLQRHTAHALFTIDSAMVEFFAACIEWSAAEALYAEGGSGDGSFTARETGSGVDSSGSDPLHKIFAHKILTHMKGLSSLIRSLPVELFDALTKRADLLQSCASGPLSSLKENVLSTLDVSLTSKVIKDSAKELAKTSSVQSPIWQVLLPPNSTASLVDSATTSLFNPPAIRHLKLSTKVAPFDLGLVERAVNRVGVQAALNRAILFLSEWVSESGTGVSLFNSQSVMYPGPIPPLLPSMKSTVSKPIVDTAAPSSVPSQQQTSEQTSASVVSSLVATPSSVEATKTAQKSEKDHSTQANKQVALQGLGSGVSVLISKEAIRRSEKDREEEEEVFLKKQKRETEVVDAGQEEEEEEDSANFSSAQAVGSSSTMADNDGENSESEAACIIS